MQETQTKHATTTLTQSSSQSDAPKRTRGFAVFKNRDFRLLWTGAIGLYLLTPYIRQADEHNEPPVAPALTAALETPQVSLGAPSCRCEPSPSSKTHPPKATERHRGEARQSRGAQQDVVP